MKFMNLESRVNGSVIFVRMIVKGRYAWVWWKELDGSITIYLWARKWMWSLNVCNKLHMIWVSYWHSEWILMVLIWIMHGKSYDFAWLQTTLKIMDNLSTHTKVFLEGQTASKWPPNIVIIIYLYHMLNTSIPYLHIFFLGNQTEINPFICCKCVCGKQITIIKS